jgi:hypothetical protein
MTNEAGPNIVYNGLVLYLDAANSRSYPGSGATWTDLSGNGNNGTLVNTPTYSSSNNGYFTSITRTMDFFIKPESNTGQKIYVGIRVSSNRLYVANESGFWDVGFGDYSYNSNYTGTRANVTLSWTHICLVINSGICTLYVNGNQTITKTADTAVSLSGQYTIGSYFADNVRDAPSLQGISDISSFKIYNRALSLSEVKQNYAALKGRYQL